MTMKTCGKCKLDKELKEFATHPKRPDGLQSHCRECQKTYRREHYIKNRAKYVEKARVWNENLRRINQEHLVAYLLDHPCVDCGESDIVVLQFDHIGDNKEFEVGKALSEKQWPLIEAEIEKCEVRCANCHVRITQIRRGGSYRTRANEALMAGRLTSNQ